MGILERSLHLQVDIQTLDPSTQTCSGVVSSSAGDDKYHVVVHLKTKNYTCGCTDQRIRHRTCKHVLALLLAVRRKIRP